MQPSTYRLGYRSDIEGLRAVAILLVVAAHAHAGLFAGGFVGVDMFFVLSGYLITGLLAQEIEKSGEVRFAHFYAGRFRRLLPGLLLMLACTTLLCNQLIAPIEQPEQASAAAAAALWLSNFYFAFDHLDYFSPGSEKNLVLHTWSLGVEEQFYLVWPLLLVLATGAWAGARRLPQLRRIKFVMPAILLASLAASAAWASIDPALSFYMMPARAWQFALGALVFAWFGTPASNTGRAGDNRLHAPPWLGWVGLAVALASSMLLSPNMTYPWPWALAPSFGAAAILASGARNADSGVGALLSLRPLQAIGRVSYSWYLWHWPVLLIGSMLMANHGPLERFTLVVLSLVIAAAAYRYIETPIRRQRALLAFPRAAVAGSLAVMTLAGGVGVNLHDTALERMHRPEQMRYINMIFDGPIIYGMGCDDWYKSADVHPCTFGPANASHTAVIIGDSIALQWFPAVAKIFSAPDWRLIALTKSACPMVDAPIFYDRVRRIYTECGQWRDAALQTIAKLKPEVVLVGSAYAYKYSLEQWQEGTASVLKAISGTAGHIYLLRATPLLPFNALNCLAPRGDLYRALAGEHPCIAPAGNAQSDSVYERLTAAAREFPNVTMIDLTDAVCPGGICSAERDGIIVFRDSQHMTTRFAETLAGPLARALNMPLAAAAANPGGPAAKIGAAMSKSPP